LPRATRNEERVRLLDATKGQLSAKKRSEREAALLERSTASLGQPLCKAEPGAVRYGEFEGRKVGGRRTENGPAIP
jgi:hypothetical protein